MKGDDDMSNEQDLKIYRSLFRKVNLDDHMLYIPSYMQPLIYIALETDDTMKELLNMMYYVGEYVHLKEFKKFVLELKLSIKNKEGIYEERNFISKTTLSSKLKTMELIGLIEIKGYRIRLTSQALSYYNDVYTKVQSRLSYESKLEKVTRAKLLAYTLSIVPIKNDTNLERVNIYRYSPYGFVVLQSNDEETFNQYKNKLSIIINLIVSDIKDQLFVLSNEFIKYKDIESPSFKSEKIDDFDVSVYLEESIHSKYKQYIDDILESKYLVNEDGYKVTVFTNVNFVVKVF